MLERLGAQIVEIHDDSALGVASSRVAQCVLINMGHTPLMWHTEILSSTTDRDPDPCSLDTTELMAQTLKRWRKLGIVVDGIQTGWLRNPEQINLILNMREVLTHDKTVVLVDPVLGDSCNIYSRKGIAENISRLTTAGNIITPNPTEAAILLGKNPKEYGVRQDGTISAELAQDLVIDLASTHDSLAILKSVVDERDPNRIGVCIRFTEDNTAGARPHPVTEIVFTKRIRIGSTGGTGDAFATLIMGQWLRQDLDRVGKKDDILTIVETSMGIISDSLSAVQNEKNLPFLSALARQVNRVFWR